MMSDPLVSALRRTSSVSPGQNLTYSLWLVGTGAKRRWDLVVGAGMATNEGLRAALFGGLSARGGAKGHH